MYFISEYFDRFLSVCVCVCLLCKQRQPFWCWFGEVRDCIHGCNRIESPEQKKHSHSHCGIPKEPKVEESKIKKGKRELKEGLEVNFRL